MNLKIKLITIVISALLLLAFITHVSHNREFSLDNSVKEISRLYRENRRDPDAVKSYIINHPYCEKLILTEDGKKIPLGAILIFNYCFSVDMPDQQIIDIFTWAKAEGEILGFDIDEYYSLTSK